MAAVQSHGVEVHFELLGRGFPFVMLPPAGFDGSFWRLAGYIDALDDMVTCVPVDPRGLGGSTRPAEARGYGWARSPATSSPSRITWASHASRCGARRWAAPSGCCLPRNTPTASRASS